MTGRFESRAGSIAAPEMSFKASTGIVAAPSDASASVTTSATFESGDRFTGQAAHDSAAHIVFEVSLIRRVEPRHVEAAADVFSAAEPEILRPRDEHVVDENDRIPPHAEPGCHRRTAVLLDDHLDLAIELLRHVADQQTCWIGEVSRERPADERDGDGGVRMRGDGRRGGRNRRTICRDDIFEHRRGAAAKVGTAARETFFGELDE